MPPYKLASKESQKEPTVVNVAGVKIGGGSLAMIAGPCAVESAERMDAIAQSVVAAGANILRGGALKPRTSPYAYPGMGEAGPKLLRETRGRQGTPIAAGVIERRRGHTGR